MSLNSELIYNILILALCSSIVATAVIQKIKEQLKSKKWLFWICLFASVVIGICFTLSFSDLSFKNSLWVGLITWAGADVIYKTFEEKIFKSFSDIINKDTIEIPKENEIK